MGGSSKKGGGSKSVPQIDPSKLIAQAAALNRVNVSNPFGSQQYVAGPNGTTLQTTLTPEMQALLMQQIGRASSNSPGYQLPSQHSDILNGLNTRLDQRYGIALPPPQQPAGGGSGAPTPTPSTPAPQAPAPTPSSPVNPQSGAPGPSDWEGFCVAAGSFLPGLELAEDASVGDLYPVHTPEEGHHTASLKARGRPVMQPCVVLVTDGGAALRCSVTTPFNDVDAEKDMEGSVLAPDMHGKRVWVLTEDGPEIQTVISVRDIGEHSVIPLDFGGKSFPAGDIPGALIFSHNILKGPMLNPAHAAQGMDFTFAQTEMQGNTPGIGVLGANPYAGLGGGSYNAPAPAGFELGDDGQFHETVPNKATPATAPGNAPAPQASQQQWNAFQKFLAALVPGKQTPGGGAGQWVRGAVQGVTGLPVAWGYDVYQRIKNSQDGK